MSSLFFPRSFYTHAHTLALITYTHTHTLTGCQSGHKPSDSAPSRRGTTKHSNCSTSRRRRGQPRFRCVCVLKFTYNNVHKDSPSLSLSLSLSLPPSLSLSRRGQVLGPAIARSVAASHDVSTETTAGEPSGYREGECYVCVCDVCTDFVVLKFT